MFFMAGVLGVSLLLIKNIQGPEIRFTEPAVSNQIEDKELIEKEQKYVPEEGFESRTYHFEYLCQPYSLNLPLYRSKYDYYSSLNREVFLLNTSGKNIEEEYYKQFLKSDHDEVTIQQIIDEIKYLTQANSNDDLVMALVSFVQNIEYDCEKLFSYEHLTEHDYQTSYPYETLYLNEGVCGDTSLLLSKILNQLGYGSAFLIYEDENHMALGIRCPNSVANFKEDGVGYCYIETTAPARIGVVPTGINESETLSNPRIIKAADGLSFERMSILAEQRKSQVEAYGQYILSLSTCEEINLYKKIQEAESELDDLQGELLILEGEIKPLSENLDYEIEQYNQLGCKGTVSKAKYKKCEEERKRLQSIQYTYEALAIDYNTLVDEYNAIYEVYAADFSYFKSLISQHYSCSGLMMGKDPLEIIEDRNE
jgi:hypothetical protein